MKERSAENSKFIVQQKLEDQHLTVADLNKQLQDVNLSAGKKNLYFGANFREISHYWSQRAHELKALVQFKIDEGCGLPSFFATASGAEFHFRPLHGFISLFLDFSSSKSKDLIDRFQLCQALQESTHIIAHYFDLRTQSYFKHVMGPVFGFDAYWYRLEFAKTRGMIHWHYVCWRSDKEPHPLLFQAVSEGLTNSQCAEKPAAWASACFNVSASHPAGTDDSGQPLRSLWPPPEGIAPARPDEQNLLLRLLMDVSSTQESLLEDYLQLTN